MSGPLHGLYNCIKRNNVTAVRHQGVLGAVHHPRGGEGVALDAGYLDQAADRVAGQAEEMLHAHGGGALNLGRSAPEETGGGGTGHGAGAGP